MGRFYGCREPSVPRCLSCTRKECDVVSGVPLHRSEIIAEINVGMMSVHALAQHDVWQRRISRHHRRSRSDREALDEILQGCR